MDRRSSPSSELHPSNTGIRHSPPHARPRPAEPRTRLDRRLRLRPVTSPAAVVPKPSLTGLHTAGRSASRPRRAPPLPRPGQPRPPPNRRPCAAGRDPNVREVPQPHVGTGHAGPQGESEVFQHADGGGASARSTGRVSDLYGDVRRRAALGRVDGPGSGRPGPVGGRGIGRRGQNPAGRGIPYWVASGGGHRLRRAAAEAAGGVALGLGVVLGSFGG